MPEHASPLFEKLPFQKPQVNLARPTAMRMWLISLCAFLVILQSSLGDSFSSLIVAACAVAAAVLVEFLFLYRSGKIVALKDGSAVASALVLALFLPNQISPLYAAAGAVFAMAVVKYSFGGLGSNWLNPAAGAWLFVRFSWPAAFAAPLEASSFSLLTEQAAVGLHHVNNAITAASGGYMGLLASPFPGIIADRGVGALLVGAIIIMAFRVNRFWIPLVYLAVFGFLTRFAGGLPYGGELWSGDVLFAISSGGTLAAALFLAADPVTGAKSNGCILLVTAVGGALAFFLRFYGAEPYAAVLAAVFINAIIPLVRVFERHRLYERYS